jgi:hypothetical protein
VKPRKYKYANGGPIVPRGQSSPASPGVSGAIKDLGNALGSYAGLTKGRTETRRDQQIRRAETGDKYADGGPVKVKTPPPPPPKAPAPKAPEPGLGGTIDTIKKRRAMLDGLKDGGKVKRKC